MPTPSQTILDAASAERQIRDPQGRVLTLRRPTTLDRLRLFKAVGPTLANNDRYLGIAMLAYTVVAIDGVPVPQPTNEFQIEAAVGRLGDDAIDFIAAAFEPTDVEGLAVANPGN